MYSKYENSDLNGPYIHREREREREREVIRVIRVTRIMQCYQGYQNYHKNKYINIHERCQRLFRVIRVMRGYLDLIYIYMQILKLFGVVRVIRAIQGYQGYYRVIRVIRGKLIYLEGIQLLSSSQTDQYLIIVFYYICIYIYTGWLLWLALRVIRGYHHMNEYHVSNIIYQGITWAISIGWSGLPNWSKVSGLSTVTAPWMVMLCVSWFGFHIIYDSVDIEPNSPHTCIHISTHTYIHTYIYIHRRFMVTY